MIRPNSDRTRKSRPRRRRKKLDKLIPIPSHARRAIFQGILRGDSVAELEYLGLPLQKINMLENSKYQITWLEQLISFKQEELLEIPNFSVGGLEELMNCLARYHELDQVKQQIEIELNLRKQEPLPSDLQRLLDAPDHQIEA